MECKRMNVTVIGDENVGKTCLILSFTTKKNLQTLHQYISTVFDTHSGQVEVNNVKYMLNFIDTGGESNYFNLRPSSYSEVDCFLICFSIHSRSSFINVKEKWEPEIKNYKPKVPVILVGTQLDRRYSDKDDSALVSTAEGEEMRKNIKAIKYIECSAYTRQGVQEVFISAACAALNYDRSIKKKTLYENLCIIL